jgi:hypothetical protein
MNGQQLLAKFHLYIGDQSELSAADELDLLNTKYDDVMSDRPWNFLKQTYTGSILPITIQQMGQAVSMAYIALPTGFRQFVENNESTDNSSTTYNNASQKVIYTGPSYTPYQIINWSDRRAYTGGANAYLDIANNRILFSQVPVDTVYEFDAIVKWAPLTVSTSPVFPSEYHMMLPQMMGVDSVIMDLFDRSHSYAAENAAGAMDKLKRMQLWDSAQRFN